MPKQVDIEIFLIAQTKVNRENVDKWLDYMGVEDFVLPDEEEITDPALLIALAAKRCYKSFEPGLNPNVTKVRKNYVEYFDNILKSRHGSVLEHSTYTFAIENVSRVFTAEMNRHRAGWAISEGSLRFIRFDQEIQFWMPTSLQEHPDDELDISQRKFLSRQVFMRAFEEQEDNYAALLHIWDMDSSNKNFHYKKTVTSCLRRIIGMGVATGGTWTGNIRAIRHVLAMRTDKLAAEEEIHYVFCKIAKMIIEKEPLLFSDFKEINGSFVPENWKV